MCLTHEQRVGFEARPVQKQILKKENNFKSVRYINCLARLVQCLPMPAKVLQVLATYGLHRVIMLSPVLPHMLRKRYIQKTMLPHFQYSSCPLKSFHHENCIVKKEKEKKKAVVRLLYF